MSDRGAVRRTGSTKKLSVQFRRGRAVVHLQVASATKTFIVRRLVADAFLGPLPPGCWVMHRDGNMRRLSVSNLIVVPAGEGPVKAAELTTQRAAKARRKKSKTNT
nr:HNH endonuclease [Rubripirellula tenax]